MCRKEERMHYARILAQEGHSQAEIGRRLGVSDRMVRKYLKKDFGTKLRAVRSSKLDPYKPTIDTVLDDEPFFNLEVLAERLRIQGYTGGLTILRAYAASVRSELLIKAARRFETEPGLQAQVDWKECGRWHIDGQERKLYAFVMVLGYSRKPFVLFTTDMRSPTVLAAHLRAFAHFEGIPREILYDNMKTAWLRDDDGWRVHPALLSLSAHCGFTPRRCKVRRPQTKGKVERFIGFLGHHFLPRAKARDSATLDELNDEVLRWLDEIDHKPVGSLRETRRDRFEREKPRLRPFAAYDAPDVRESVDLVVSRSGTVQYKSNEYSVPAAHLGRTLVLKRDALTCEAELSWQGEIVRRIRLLPEGSHRRDIRPEDAASLRARWERENRSRPALKVVRSRPGGSIPPMDRGIIVEVRHPSRYEALNGIHA